MMKLFSFSLLLFAVSALPAAPSWIWLPDRSRSAAFRKTVTLDEEVRSAVFHIACDGAPCSTSTANCRSGEPIRRGLIWPC